jgi:hypothetical protein
LVELGQSGDHTGETDDREIAMMEAKVHAGGRAIGTGHADHAGSGTIAECCNHVRGVHVARELAGAQDDGAGGRHRR